MIRLVNEIRSERGLATVEIDNTLMMAARFHAQTCAQLENPNHDIMFHNWGPYATDPNADHGASFNAATAFGAQLSWTGGNGAAGQTTPEELVQGWMDSPPHRAYMLSPEHRYIGAGSHVGGPPYGIYHYMFLSDRPSLR